MTSAHLYLQTRREDPFTLTLHHLRHHTAAAGALPRVARCRERDAWRSAQLQRESTTRRRVQPLRPPWEMQAAPAGRPSPIVASGVSPAEDVREGGEHFVVWQWQERVILADDGPVSRQELRGLQQQTVASAERSCICGG